MNVNMAAALLIFFVALGSLAIQVADRATVRSGAALKSAEEWRAIALKFEAAATSFEDTSNRNLRNLHQAIEIGNKYADERDRAVRELQRMKYEATK